MSTASNFDHLADLDPDLATLGAHAERYFADDANTALIKTRQFAERMAVVVAARSGVEVEGAGSLLEILRRLQFDHAAPREVLDVLHRLRREGNDAVHGLAGERRAAFDALKLCHGLGVWLRATAANQPGLTMRFVPPRLREDDTEALRSRVEELRARLEAAETAAETRAREARQAEAARLTAEERAALAEEERQVFEELALGAEARATAADTEPRVAQTFVAAAFEAALDLDEGDTRLLVDEQLRRAGWEARPRRCGTPRAPGPSVGATSPSRSGRPRRAAPTTLSSSARRWWAW